LADGTAFTASVPASIDGRHLLFARPHSAPGLLAGVIPLVSEQGTDFESSLYRSPSGFRLPIYWSKPAQRKGSLYRAGFGPLPLDLNLTLLPWVSVSSDLPGGLGLGSTGNVILNLEGDDNFGNNALTSRANNYELPIELQFSATGRLTFVEPDSNRTAYTFSFNKDTGTYSGEFTVTEEIVPPATRPLARKVAYKGIFQQVPGLLQGDIIGQGYFVLPPLAPATLSTSGLHEYRAGVLPGPFDVTNDN
jgi:hypothetical protein